MNTRRAFIKATILAGARRLDSAVPASDLTWPPELRLTHFDLSARARPRHPSGRLRVRHRVVWTNPGADKHPAVVALCETDDDVIRCIEFAREQELKLAVRSGGHSNLGWGTGDGLVLDVSRLKNIAVDMAQRTIRVGSGVTAEAMVSAAAKHGLAPVLGQCGSVGAGLGLGGGLGWLSGRYGAT